MKDFLNKYKWVFILLGLVGFFGARIVDPGGWLLLLLAPLFVRLYLNAANRGERFGLKLSILGFASNMAVILTNGFKMPVTNFKPSDLKYVTDSFHSVATS